MSFYLVEVIQLVSTVSEKNHPIMGKVVAFRKMCVEAAKSLRCEENEGNLPIVQIGVIDFHQAASRHQKYEHRQSINI